MAPVESAATNTSLQPPEELLSPNAEEQNSNEVDTTQAIKNQDITSDDTKPASESRADLIKRMKSRSKSAIEHHSYHRERIVVDEDLYVKKYGFRQSKLFVRGLGQELETLSRGDRGAYAQLRNLAEEDVARELDIGRDSRAQRSNENERVGKLTPGHAAIQNRASRSEPNLVALEEMEQNDEGIEELAEEISEKSLQQDQREGDSESEDKEVGKAGEDSAQAPEGVNAEKANESTEDDAGVIAVKYAVNNEGDRTGEDAGPDAKQSAKDDATANASNTNENTEKDAGNDSKDDVNGDPKRGDVNDTISHAEENTEDDAKPAAKENAREERKDDANKNTKEKQQHANENAKPGASAITNENAKRNAEHVEGSPDRPSEAVKIGKADLTTNHVDTEDDQRQADGSTQKPDRKDIRGDGTQNGEKDTKYQASCVSETGSEESKDENDASKKLNHDTGFNIRDNKKIDEHASIATASAETGRRTRVEESIHIELSKSRRNRERPVSPPRRDDPRRSAGMIAIDHHSYYRGGTIVEEVPVVPYVPEYARRDRERTARRRASISGLRGETRNDAEKERERERDDDRDRDRITRRLERDPEREWLERQLGQDMENRRRERLEERELGRERIRRKAYHEREREGNRRPSRGPDTLEVKQPSHAHARSPSATSRRHVEIISEQRGEQNRVETSVRPRIITIPPQPGSASNTKLGVLGPKTYHYHPLKEMEFRLIKILPERMSILKTELLHHSLHDTLDYIAISYAWGDGVNTEELFLDGTKVPVATSLYDALKAVRQKKTEILVWVDALCIDQQNAQERATQVRLMGTIYSKATSTAVWLGPEADESELAMDLLQDVSDDQATPQRIKAIQQRIRATNRYPESAALFTLFKREYWRRLWCIQEVLLAKETMVYCGDAVFPWEVYRKAAEAFWDSDSDPHVRQGPSSFPDKDALMQLGDASLLEVMRTCRKQLSENPRDKVFGILGLLPVETQREFPVDYSQSVKTVYTDVVDYLISTTDRLDVIRESIHFPINVNNAGLPSWCPDWSYIPQSSGLGRTLGFDASKGSDARYKFHDKRRKLEIVGIQLDTIKATGVAVGTFCSSQDYLMAFLHWRAILLDEISINDRDSGHNPQTHAFCRTLCLGQVPENHVLNNDWPNLCLHVFSSLLTQKFPYLVLDAYLSSSSTSTTLIEPDARRKFLQDHFGNRMMGRSFCITEHGLMGMGSGYMTTDDVVVVPFGCSTPIVLRPEGRRNEYRYIGDVYVDGYMHGEAVGELEEGKAGRKVSKYMLC